MNWSINDYIDILKIGGQEAEEKLLRMFPPGETELINSPCVIVDKNGKILLWYLPQVISPKRRVSKFANEMYSDECY